MDRAHAVNAVLTTLFAAVFIMGNFVLFLLVRPIPTVVVSVVGIALALTGCAPPAPHPTSHPAALSHHTLLSAGILSFLRRRCTRRGMAGGWDEEVTTHNEAVKASSADAEVTGDEEKSGETQPLVGGSAEEEESA